LEELHIHNTLWNHQKLGNSEDCLSEVFNSNMVCS
jgi:hypothetical protein